MSQCAMVLRRKLSIAVNHIALAEIEVRMVAELDCGIAWDHDEVNCS